jgi:peptidoglycan-associated lipoprotein
MRLTLVMLVAALGCGSAKKAEETTTPTKVADKEVEAVKDPDVSQDKKVSDTLAMSGDLIQICGIKATASSASPSFDYDDDQLSQDDRAVLEQLATCLTKGPLAGKAVSLIGRADPRGTQEYNLALGSRRADSVGDYLSRLGVAAAQLMRTTRGALDATGTDEAGWAKDRRVDIQLAKATE